ncbi:hypothetical protein Rs2_25211 [Raphanus sativus]|nr:hypothetical protein Rs2_25211 [Raphanus sativus]
MVLWTAPTALDDFLFRPAIDLLCTAKLLELNLTTAGVTSLARSAPRRSCGVNHHIRDPNNVVVLRYRVELFFSEETDEAMFVAFDTEMIKLTNVYVLLKLGISRR